MLFGAFDNFFDLFLLALRNRCFHLVIFQDPFGFLKRTLGGISGSRTFPLCSNFTVNNFMPGLGAGVFQCARVRQKIIKWANLFYYRHLKGFIIDRDAFNDISNHARNLVVENQLPRIHQETAFLQSQTVNGIGTCQCREECR